MYTPFDAQGAIDRPGLRRLITYLIDAGAVGLAMTGNASESAWLDGAERRQLAEWTADAVDGRVPLIAGANAPDTAEAIGLARHAITCGAETVFCGAPLMGSGAGPDLVRHFYSLADAISVPLMLQNSPLAPIGLDELLEAAEHPNVCYVKEESLNAGQMLSALRERAPELGVYTGGKNPIEDVARGARGGIPGSVGVADLVACHAAARADDQAEARRRYLHVAPLLFAIRANPLSLAKEILRRLGVIQHAGTRSPNARPLDDGDQIELGALMQALGPPY